MSAARRRMRMSRKNDIVCCVGAKRDVPEKRHGSGKRRMCGREGWQILGSCYAEVLSLLSSMFLIIKSGYVGGTAVCEWTRLLQGRAAVFIAQQEGPRAKDRRVPCYGPRKKNL